MYNFSKVVGDHHLEFLTETVAVHVPWDDIAVRPGDFHWAARIGASLPWLKVALITAQYFPPEDKLEKGPFGKNYRNLVSREGFERVAKARPTENSPLGKAEAFLSYLAGMYLKTAGLPSEQLALEIPAAFARSARAVLLSKEMGKDEIDIVKVEVVLRQKLAPAALPPPFSKEVLEKEEG